MEFSFRSSYSRWFGQTIEYDSSQSACVGKAGVYLITFEVYSRFKRRLVVWATQLPPNPLPTYHGPVVESILPVEVTLWQHADQIQQPRANKQNKYDNDDCTKWLDSSRQYVIREQPPDQS